MECRVLGPSQLSLPNLNLGGMAWKLIKFPSTPRHSHRRTTGLLAVKLESLPAQASGGLGGRMTNRK